MAGEIIKMDPEEMREVMLRSLVIVNNLIITIAEKKKVDYDELINLTDKRLDEMYEHSKKDKSGKEFLVQAVAAFNIWSKFAEDCCGVPADLIEGACATSMFAEDGDTELLKKIQDSNKSA